MSPQERWAYARQLRWKRDFLGACAVIGIVLGSVALEHRPPAPLYYLFFPGALLFAIPAIEASLWILSKSEDWLGIRVWYSVPAIVTMLVILIFFAAFLIPARLFALHAEYRRARAAAVATLNSSKH
jgi:hypothetical protein